MIAFIKNYLKTFSFSGVDAAIDEIINGSYILKNTVINRTIKINGEAILGGDLIIQKNIIINGALNAKEVSFESGLEVNGNTSLCTSSISDNSIFSGTLEAKKSLFKKETRLLVSRACFDACQFDNIVIQSLPGKKVVQTIHLSNKTKVKANIEFQSGRGEVYIDDTSAIDGCVVGGQVKPKNDV